jgi:hypothetical protein
MMTCFIGPPFFESARIARTVTSCGAATGSMNITRPMWTLRTNLMNNLLFLRRTYGCIGSKSIAMRWIAPSAPHAGSG